jgi:hypothetical protein
LAPQIDSSEGVASSAVLKLKLPGNAVLRTRGSAQLAPVRQSERARDAHSESHAVSQQNGSCVQTSWQQAPLAQPVPVCD